MSKYKIFPLAECYPKCVVIKGKQLRVCANSREAIDFLEGHDITLTPSELLRLFDGVCVTIKRKRKTS